MNVRKRWLAIGGAIMTFLGSLIGSYINGNGIFNKTDVSTALMETLR